jgi:3D (Asp-Asp-Asp) domain-containing protein
MSWKPRSAAFGAATVTVSVALSLLVISPALGGASGSHAPKKLVMTATAYCLRGLTASGEPVRKGTIAADPRILPMGSLVRIRGRHVHGNYVVGDSGSAIKGHRIDIFMPSCEQARRFGRQRVTVEVRAADPDISGSRQPATK